MSANAGMAPSTRRAPTARQRAMTIRFVRKARAIIRGHPPKRASGTLEARIALLDEGRDALREVVAADQLVLDLGLQVQLRLQIGVEHLVQGALGARVRARRALRQLARQLLGLLRE